MDVYVREIIMIDLLFVMNIMDYLKTEFKQNIRNDKEEEQDLTNVTEVLKNK